MTATSPVRGLSSAVSGRRFASQRPTLLWHVRCPGRWSAGRRTGGRLSGAGRGVEGAPLPTAVSRCLQPRLAKRLAGPPSPLAPRKPTPCVVFSPSLSQPRTHAPHHERAPLFAPTHQESRYAFPLATFPGAGAGFAPAPAFWGRGARFPRMRDCPPPDPTFGEACGLSFSGPGVALSAALAVGAWGNPSASTH